MYMYFYCSAIRAAEGPNYKLSKLRPKHNYKDLCNITKKKNGGF